MNHVDVTVLGGGIVGLATMYRLQERFPKLTTALIEKEPKIGQHQTGHNSGVLHSGIYYKPGSSKAVNCREGKAAMEAVRAALLESALEDVITLGAKVNFDGKFFHQSKVLF